MATKNMRYDHEQYTVHQAIQPGEVGGAAATAYAKFCAFTAIQLFAAQMTVTVQGTATTNTLIAQYVTSTSTTALGTASFGVSTIGVTSNVQLGTGTLSSGGFAVPQGGFVQILSGTDATGKAAVSYEYMVLPLANITA